VHAIAQLEFVRTLRDLGAGLDDIRRVLATETTLHDLAAAHLRLVEEQLLRSEHRNRRGGLLGYRELGRDRARRRQVGGVLLTQAVFTETFTRIT
jgi:hypothetical protein